MGKTSSGAMDRYSSTLKILKTKRPYDLLFQDEDEGVEGFGLNPWRFISPQSQMKTGLSM